MIKTLLKHTDKGKIWIEGFDKTQIVKWNQLGYYLKYLVNDSPNDNRELVYWGITSEIDEELAKKHILFVDTSHKHPNYRTYNYEGGEWYNTAKESIQSACPYEYCIIYKESE